MAEYAKRDIEALGEFYTRHISAMTGEELHSKSDIAAELAWRDMMISNLQDQILNLHKQFSKVETRINASMSAAETARQALYFLSR